MPNYVDLMSQRASEARVTNDERRVPCMVDAEIHSKGTWCDDETDVRTCLMHVDQAHTVPPLDRTPLPWRPACNGAGKRAWFVCRRLHAETQRLGYHESASGDLVRFASMEAAQRRADQLNAEPS